MRKAEKWFYRSQKMYNKGRKKTAEICTYILRVIYGCDILPQTKIEENVELVHNGLGFVIHPGAIIKSGCKIYQNVTIGGNSKIKNGIDTNHGAPIIEENVIIFAGACVLGPIRIGKGAIIGANCVITKDVPIGAMAYGNPAIISQK